MKTIIYQLASLHTKLDALKVEVRQNSEVIQQIASIPSKLQPDDSTETDTINNLLPIVQD